MERFIKSVRNAINQKNWYAALALALTLPDMCGYLEYGKASEARYTSWYNQFLLNQYSRNIGADGRFHIFLSGEDCYALRCAFLHQGSNEIIRQRARKALDKFYFIAPQGNYIHLNQSNNTLQLQVDVFCEDICSAVEKWELNVAKSDSDIQNRFAEIITIHGIENNEIFIF